jgi:hypothetical protein
MESSWRSDWRRLRGCLSAEKGRDTSDEPPGLVEDQAAAPGAPPRKDLDLVRTYVLTHLSDASLLSDLHALLARERTAAAAVLAHIAEVDARRLYLPAGFPSMFAYCVGQLRFSEDAAYKRIQAARTARQFPAIFTALAEGRLHLAAVCLLAPHLTPENADELLAEATHKTRSDIELLLAHRFPRTELLALVQAIPGSPPLRSDQLAPGQVEADAPERGGAITGQLAPGQVEAPVPRPRLTPLSPERYALQVTIGQETHEKLRYVQALLSHRLPSGDLAQVLDLALDALMGQLEQQKFAATETPRPPSGRPSASPRHIPAHVKRAVWQRDQGQCTFVTERGERCRSRKFLEYDHIEPVARNGQATVSRVRLRCRGHNQLEAERTFGAEFMKKKREEARSRAAADAHARDVMACLRELGFRASETRRAAEFCESSSEATLEEQVRAALKFLSPRTRAMSPDAWT